MLGRMLQASSLVMCGIRGGPILCSLSTCVHPGGNHRAITNERPGEFQTDRQWPEGSFSLKSLNTGGNLRLLFSSNYSPFATFAQSWPGPTWA